MVAIADPPSHSALLATPTPEQILELKPMIVALVRSVPQFSQDIDDLLQEAWAAAATSALRFDIARGATLATYARQRIHGAAQRAARREHNRRLREPTFSYHESAAEPTPSHVVDPGQSEPPDEATAGESRTRVRDFVAGLSDRERYVIERVFYEDATQLAVAAELGVSPAAISKMLSRVYVRGRADLADLN